MIFVPDTYIPSNIYLPFHSVPNKSKITLNQLIIEPDSNGLNSIVNFRSNNNLIPYIDFSKFDVDTKGWFWFDSSSVPYSMSFTYIGSVKKYLFTSLLTGESVISDNIDLKWDSLRSELFIETNAPSIKLYKYSPITIVCNGIPLNDITDYIQFTTNMSELFDIGNYEFYYDFDSRCYTTLDLTNMDENSIEIYYYKTASSLDVRCVLSTNTGNSSDYTPYIDNYLVKMRGQYLRN